MHFSPSARAHLQELMMAIISDASNFIIDGSLANELGDIVSQQSLNSESAEALLTQAFDSDHPELLDYGCGGGHHRAFLENIGYKWTGVEYLASVSPGVRTEVAQKHEIVFYDGKHLPFSDASFDVVSPMFVLNCLRDFNGSMAEIARVLRPGGLVIGQTGALEPMMDYIAFNPTPYGLKCAAEDAGLSLTQIYPKHDAFTFLSRQFAIKLSGDDETPFESMLNPDGFFYRELEKKATAKGLAARDINLLKLQFSGHLCFVMQKSR